MNSTQFVRRVLISGAAVGVSSQVNATKCDQVCRASELPIYMSDEECRRKKREDLCPPSPGVLESVFGSVRRSAWSMMEKMAYVQQEAGGKLQEGSEYAGSLYKYLSEESDDSVKTGAVGVGALTGFVLGLRGGWIRRFFFAGTGAYGMAAVCYPNQTAEYTKEGINHIKKYATIGYNFVYGVKKDDIPLPDLPKLPSSMGEVWEIAGEFGKTASSFITGGKPEENTTAGGSEETEKKK